MKKICSKCGRELPLSDFYTQKSGKYNVSSICRECASDIGKMKRLESKIREIIHNILHRKGRPAAYRAYCKELDSVEFKPHLKEDFNYTVVVSQVKDCWITVEAKSRDEAVFRAYSALYSGGVYMEDDVIFDENAKLESVELDEIPDDEDFIDLAFKDVEK